MFIEFDWDEKLTSFESIPMMYLRTFIHANLCLNFIHRGSSQKRERNEEKAKDWICFSFPIFWCLTTKVSRSIYYFMSSPGFLLGGSNENLGSCITHDQSLLGEKLVRSEK